MERNGVRGAERARASAAATRGLPYAVRHLAATENSLEYREACRQTARTPARQTSRTSGTPGR